MSTTWDQQEAYCQQLQDVFTVKIECLSLISTEKCRFPQSEEHRGPERVSTVIKSSGFRVPPFIYQVRNLEGPGVCILLHTKFESHWGNHTICKKNRENLRFIEYLLCARQWISRYHLLYLIELSQQPSQVLSWLFFRWGNEGYRVPWHSQSHLAK